MGQRREEDSQPACHYGIEGRTAVAADRRRVRRASVRGPLWHASGPTCARSTGEARPASALPVSVRPSYIATGPSPGHGPFHVVGCYPRQALVGTQRVLRPELLLRHGGAHHEDAVETLFGRDRGLLAPIGEGLVKDVGPEMIGALKAVQCAADAQADRVRPARAAVPPRRVAGTTLSSARSVAYSNASRLRWPLRLQQRVEAGHEALDGEVGMLDLDHFLAIKMDPVRRRIHFPNGPLGE